MAPFHATRRLLWNIPEVFRHVQPRPNPQPILVQRVKFLRSPIWRRTLASVVTTIFFLAAWRAYDQIVLEPLFQAANKKLDDEDMKDLQEDEEPIFIPFPFTTRTVRVPPYTGSDPEWRKFLEINHDKELGKDIRRRLAHMCASTAKRSPYIVRSMGNEISVNYYWLDIQYPYTPAPEVRRRGLELTDESLSWVERKVDLSASQRVDRTLWPTALTASVFSFSLALLRQNVTYAGRLIGLSSSWQQTQQEAAQMALNQAAEKLARKRREQNKSTPPTIKGPGSPEPSKQTQTGPLTTENPNKPPLPADPKTEETDQKIRPQDLYPYTSMRESLNDPMTAFSNTLKKEWRHVRNFPPRGSILIQGMVELQSPRALAVIDCTAWWDPGTKNFVDDNTRFSLRYVKDKTQRPLR